MNTSQREQTTQNPLRRKATRKRVHWWLRLTSSGWNLPQATLEQREWTRQSQMASWIILGLLVADVVLLPVGIDDPGTLIAIILVGGGLLLAVWLNRLGLVTWAGTLIIFLICGGVLGSLVMELGGLALDALPAYDLLAIAVIVAASVLPRWSAFVVAAVNVGLICLDFWLQPYAANLQQELQSYPSLLSGALALLARPVALQIVLATVAYLWVRGMQAALARADRAEELAALEHAIAEQRRQLESGVQEILEVLVRVANGQPGARIPVSREQLLWQIASALNNLLNRLQRASLAEQELYRTQEAIGRLVAAIEDVQAGGPPLWPAPTGTQVDLLIERMTGARHRAGSSSSQAAQFAPLSAQQAAKKNGVKVATGDTPHGNGHLPRAPGYVDG
jgi:hypothetical protein